MLTILQISDLIAAEENSGNFFIADMFVNGGIVSMSMITLLLILMLFAVWKAPRWIKEIGLAAPVLSMIMVLAHWCQAASAVIKCNGAIHPNLIWAGIRYSGILIVYGLIVYLVSLILRIVLKPRI